MKICSRSIAALSLLVALAACAHHRVGLHASWHLVNEKVKVEKVCGKDKVKYDQNVYVLMTNVGRDPVTLKGFEVIVKVKHKKHDWKEDLTLETGEIAVIKIGELKRDLDCRFPTAVKAQNIRDDIPISTIPSYLPRDAETRCRWPKAERSSEECDG